MSGLEEHKLFKQKMLQVATQEVGPEGGGVRHLPHTGVLNSYASSKISCTNHLRCLLDITDLKI